MVQVLCALVAVLAVGFAILAYEWWGLPRRRHRVIVNFRDEKAPSIAGILWQRRGRWLVLRDCYLLETAKATPTRIDGEVTLDRGLVLFLQIPDGPLR
jgi:hypothetical protein